MNIYLHPFREGAGQFIKITTWNGQRGYDYTWGESIDSFQTISDMRCTEETDLLA
jgi:hypothetical protein